MNDLQTSNNIITRTPELIAAEINSIKSQTKRMLLYNSIEIGRRLKEAKQMLNHGEWGDWLEKSVDYSQRTANNLMKVFDEYGADQISLFGPEVNSQALANLSYTQAVILLGLPDSEREKFVEDNDVDNISTRELQQLVKERDQALKEKEEALKKFDNAKMTAIEKCEEANRLREEKLKAESELRTTDQVLREKQKDIKSLQDALKEERNNSQLKMQKMEKSLDDTKTLLTAAQASGNEEEVVILKGLINVKEEELHNSKMKIQELERQLAEKPIEVTSERIIEKIPEEIEKELDELRKNQKSETILKFKVYFDELVQNFKNLLKQLNEISDNEPESYESYKKAVMGLISKMSDNL